MIPQLLNLHIQPLHPFLGCALYFIYGILWHQQPSFLLLFLTGLTPLLFYKNSNPTISAKNLILFLCFGALGAIRCGAYLNQHSANQTMLAGKEFTITGTINDIRTTHHPHLRYATTCSISSIEEMPGCNQPLDGLCTLYSKIKPSLYIQDQIQIKQVCFKKTSDTSFAQYLAREGMIGTAVIDEKNLELIKRPRYSFLRWIYSKKNKLLLSLKKNISLKTHTLLTALFFGNKFTHKWTFNKIKKQFKQWGASHYLARSGLHLVTFALLWEILLKILPLPFLIKQFLAMLLVFIYFLFSWSSISFMRSLAAFFTYKISTIGNLQTHGTHTMALITFLALWLNPLHLFFLDFQLSFGITFLLAWINQNNHTK